MKISDLEDYLKKIKEKHGDVYITKKQVGGGTKVFKPISVNLKLQDEAIIQRKIVNSESEMTIKAKGKCLELSYAFSVEYA